MSIITASEARERLYHLIDMVAASHVPVTIKGKHNDAVLISAKDWATVQETLHLLSVPGLRESIRAAMTEPLHTSARKLEW